MQSYVPVKRFYEEVCFECWKTDVVNHVTVMKHGYELVTPSLNNCVFDISDSLSRIVAVRGLVIE
jgi:hypothetical protein